MKRNIFPEVWGFLGLLALTGSLFLHGARSNFVCIMGMLFLVHGKILDVRRELDRWGRM